MTANSTGGLYGEVRYYAFGGTRYNQGTTPTTYRYTGQRQESALGGLDGLYFYNARWYDPSLGRFAQPDTMVPGTGNPQQLNRYAYTNNNPLKYTDPSGHCIEDACIGEAALAMAAATAATEWAESPAGQEFIQEELPQAETEASEALAPVIEYGSQEVTGMSAQIQDAVTQGVRDIGSGNWKVGLFGWPEGAEESWNNGEMLVKNQFEHNVESLADGVRIVQNSAGDVTRKVADIDPAAVIKDGEQVLDEAQWLKPFREGVQNALKVADEANPIQHGDNDSGIFKGIADAMAKLGLNLPVHWFGANGYIGTTSYDNPPSSWPQ